MLTDEQIKEYQFLYQKRFNKHISKENAVIQGEALIQLMKQIYKPIKINK